VTAGAVGFNYLSADRERQRMQTMFSRYVSKLVVDQLASQEELPKLDGENREVTAFFSDIRKFSTFSEKFKDDPQTLVHLLNTYLTRVSGTLLKHGACLDKYIGDAVVCIFGAPLSQPDHAVRACRAALEVQQEITRLRQEYAAKGLPDVYTRVGVNSALMFVGNFGSEQLFNYTAIGDGMNLASRLEGANKAYETLIMIGPRTYELAKDFVEARELDLARVAGKTEAVAVYELMALKGGLSDAQGQARELYVHGLALYREARFQEALGPLEQALKLIPTDGPSKVLAARCRKFAEHPPPRFDGVIDLDK
jgi:adenylate cyclase